MTGTARRSGSPCAGSHVCFSLPCLPVMMLKAVRPAQRACTARPRTVDEPALPLHSVTLDQPHCGCRPAQALPPFVLPTCAQAACRAPKRGAAQAMQLERHHIAVLVGHFKDVALLAHANLQCMVADDRASNWHATRFSPQQKPSLCTTLGWPTTPIYGAVTISPGVPHRRLRHGSPAS